MVESRMPPLADGPPDYQKDGIVKPGDAFRCVVASEDFEPLAEIVVKVLSKHYHVRVEILEEDDAGRAVVRLTGLRKLGPNEKGPKK